MVTMINKIIKYSFDLKLINHSVEKILNEQKLLKVKFDNKKFIVYFYEIENTRRGRINKEERTIQISPRIKKILLSYSAEEYEIVLLGYDLKTKTFTVWSYRNLRIQSMQSLYTRSYVLNNVQTKGYDCYRYNRRDPFDKNLKDSTWSISFNMFLFPLILKNFSILFTKKIFETLDSSIKQFNKAYDLQDLIMCIDLYSRKGNNLNKNDEELLEISNLCKLKSKLLNYYPYINFYPGDAKKFRNINGIYKKLQNLVKLDPSKKIKGLSGGSEARERKVWNSFLNNGNLDKKKLFDNSNLIKERIKSGNIYSLAGIENLPEIIKHSNPPAYPEATNDSLLQDFDFTKNYEKKKINLDSFFDPIEQLNAIDKATELHHEILKKLAKILNKKKLIHKNSRNIDLYSEFNKRGKMFEAKTFTQENVKRQLRHGIIQLKEYYFFYSKYQKIIKYETDTFLILNQNPLPYLDKLFINFIESQKICLCWFEEDKINTVDATWNKKSISWLT